MQASSQGKQEFQDYQRLSELLHELPRHTVPPEFAATVPISLATVSGAYTKVIPNELLQFTWEPTWSPGELSLVTITFEDVRGGTQINLRHERFANEQSRDGHKNGWAGALDKLATVVSEQQ